MRVNICNVGIDSLSFTEVVDKITKHIESNGPSEYIVTPNVQHVLILQKDLKFNEIYRKAFLSVPDGVPLLWAAKILGSPLKGRVNGTDLFENLCAVLAERGWKAFFLGGRPGAALKAAEILKKRFPELIVSGIYCPPYGFENDKNECQKICKVVTDAKPHILFVGLGAPKQEYWMEENYKLLNVPISIGIGGSFELVSGILPRAPKWMQNSGFEWVFRLCNEPQRLWQRYLIGNSFFIWLVIKNLLKE